MLLKDEPRVEVMLGLGVKAKGLGLGLRVRVSEFLSGVRVSVGTIF